MLEWKEAAPIIGVLITGFFGLVGVFVAKMLQGQVAAVSAAAPAVVTAAALTKEACDQSLVLALEGLSEVFTQHFIAAAKYRREHHEMLREQHDEYLTELRRLRKVMEEKQSS